MVWNRILLVIVGIAAWAHPKGILVKFLPNPAGDSVVRYDVYRSEKPGDTGSAIGEIHTGLNQDTLRFPDLSVQKGIAYFYSVRAIDDSGNISPFSPQTRVGLPRLNLPDTLRPDPTSKLTRFVLAAAGQPLKGSETLVLEVLDPDRIDIVFSDSAGRADFRSRSGKADTARVIVRATYLGKFEDRDTLIAIVPEGNASGSLARLSVRPGAMVFPARFSPSRQGQMVITNLPGPGWLEILSPLGRSVMRHATRQTSDAFSWDGRDGNGQALPLSHYVLVARSRDGRILDRGSFLLTP